MRLSKKPAKTAEAAQPADKPETVNSRLLPEALTGLESEQRLAILDLGPGDAATVSFFSQFNARMFFLDLLDCEEIIDPPEDLSLADAIKICQRHIKLPHDVYFDVVLLWDYLHYLQVPMLEALSATLQSHLMRHARGYGFGALHGDQPLQRIRYGIAGAAALVSRPPEPHVPFKAYSQQRLNEHFLCMRIGKATLLQEGRLELLFEAN
ncbi:MAG: hypothetical protein AAF993_15070 [Pseudomonadota bacterium]